MATNNAINIGANSPLSASFGGTGVSNAFTITVGGNIVTADAVTFSGAFAFTGTLTGITNVTFPTSGTLATTGQVITPVDQTSGSATLVQNTLYVTDNGASLVTYTLPATATVGSIIKIIGKSSGGWTIAQGSGQQIRFGNVTTTLGAGGSLASSNLGDSVELVCNTANTTWTVASVQGNPTVV